MQTAYLLRPSAIGAWQACKAAWQGSLQEVLHTGAGLHKLYLDQHLYHQHQTHLQQDQHQKRLLC